MKELIKEVIDRAGGGMKYSDLYSDVLVKGDLALKTTTQELMIDINSAIESMPELGILRYTDCNDHQHKFIYRNPAQIHIRKPE